MKYYRIVLSTTVSYNKQTCKPQSKTCTTHHRQRKKKNRLPPHPPPPLTLGYNTITWNFSLVLCPKVGCLPACLAAVPLVGRTGGLYGRVGRFWGVFGPQVGEPEDVFLSPPSVLPSFCFSFHLLILDSLASSVSAESASIYLPPFVNRLGRGLEAVEWLPFPNLYTLPTS